MKVSARGDPATVVGAPAADEVAGTGDPPPVVGESSGPQAVSTAALASAPITAAVFFIRNSESMSHRGDLGIRHNNADAAQQFSYRPQTPRWAKPADGTASVIPVHAA
ncbi:hypothetical protein ACQP1G_36045 [Nocardia sp. CA-107356]|uniref:hypothetical protein n=1 Tax=Nocardia sp. CA-107356 TaxID=3239972 RepID=UPI003D8A957B